MLGDIHERCQRVARYMLQYKCTIRQAAKRFQYSKSTVHKDLTKQLPLVNPELHKQVAQLLKANRLAAPIRGGLATQKRYKGKK